jgi:hypothetical protein
MPTRGAFQEGCWESTHRRVNLLEHPFQETSLPSDQNFHSLAPRDIRSSDEHTVNDTVVSRVPHR